MQVCISELRETNNFDHGVRFRFISSSCGFVSIFNGTYVLLSIGYGGR